MVNERIAEVITSVCVESKLATEDIVDTLNAIQTCYIAAIGDMIGVNSKEGQEELREAGIDPIKTQKMLENRDWEGLEKERKKFIKIKGSKKNEKQRDNTDC